MDRLFKGIKIAFFTTSTLALLFFIYLCATSHLDVYSTRKLERYEIVADMEHTQEKDASLPQGVKDIYAFTLPQDLADGAQLMFYSIHEAVEIYVNGERVYAKGLSSDTPLGQTPGNTWNMLPLCEDDAGAQIEIHMIPIYKVHIGNRPEVAVGNPLWIYWRSLSRQMLPFVCAFVAVILGIVFIGYDLVCNHSENPSGNREILIMGLFAIWAGLWKISDLSIVKFSDGSAIFWSYMALFSIMFLGALYALYEVNLFQNRYAAGLYAVPLLSVAAVLLSIILQVFGIRDIRETLFLHHGILFFLAVYSIFLLVQEVRQVGLSRKLRITIFCIMLCGLGLLLDLAVYYLSKGNTSSSFAILGMLIYIIVLGVVSVREAREWIAMGKEASGYREMAFHDPLTGCYNRTAYGQKVGAEEFQPEDYTVVMFDLNDLKKCNDTYGHDVGDLYIQSGARLIGQTFGGCGDVYRLGGDEFCVLIKGITEAECVENLDRLEQLCRSFDKTEGQPFAMRIACGFQHYEPERDFDISDTMRHADHRMYEHKLRLKQTGL